MRTLPFAAALASSSLALAIASSHAAAARQDPAPSVRVAVVEDRSLERIDGRLALAPLPRLAEGTECTAEVASRALRSGGGEKLDPMALEAWLLAHGASLRVARVDDEVRLDFSCAPDDLGATLERLRELLVAPAYPAASLDAARGALERELESEPVDPARVAPFLGGARLSRPLDLGPLADLTRDAVLDFHRRLVSPERLWVGVAGPLAPAAVREQVRRVFGELAQARPEDAAARIAVPAGLSPIVLLDAPDAERIELRLALGGSPVDPGYAERLLVASAFCAARARANGLRWTLVPATAPQTDPGTPLYLYCATDVGALAAEMEKDAGVWSYPGPLEPADVEAARRDLLEEAAARAVAPRERVSRALAVAMGRAPADAWERTSGRLRDATLDELRAFATREAAAPHRLVAVGAAVELRPLLERRGAVTVLPARTVPSGTQEGWAASGKLLDALGGRERWAALASLHTVSTASVPGVADPVRLELWSDFANGRVRVLQRAPGRDVLFVVDADGGWSREGDTVSEMAKEVADPVRERQDRALFEVLRDLARWKERSVRIDGHGRLVVLWPRGVQCWIELADDGKPARLGYTLPRASVETVYEFVEWSESGGMPYPSRLRQLERGSELATETFEPNLALDPQLFARGGEPEKH